MSRRRLRPARPPARRTVRSPARRLAAGVGVAVVLVLALLVLAEAGLRIASRLAGGEWPRTRLAAFQDQIEEAVRLYRDHPFLNTAPVPGARVEAFGKRAAFNSFGYRSPERPAAKPPGVVRVLCAGGSTTFDLLAASDEESWPWLLEGELRRRGLAVEVWNAGFPGWTSLENLISLSLRDVDLEPDLVLLYQGINDLQPGAHRPFDRQYVAGHARQSRRALGLELDAAGLLARSLLAERLRDLVAGPADPWARLRVEPGGRRHPQLAAGAGEVFGRNVRSFAAVAAAAGARVALVTQTVRVRPEHRQADLAYLSEWLTELEPAAAPDELGRFNDVLRRTAADGGVDGGANGRVVLFDVASGVDWQDADFADPMHLSPAGTGKLVAFLADAVAGALRPADPAGAAAAGAGAEGG